MYRCVAYGLRIASELPLPEVPPESFDTPDVTVRLGSPLALGENAGFGCQGTADDIQVAWLDAGVFSICGGREICIHLIADVGHETLRTYLLGPILGAVLHQRGHLVLHASGVVAPGGAVLFAGACGAGKSTTAAALNQAGWPLLTDDVAAVTQDHSVRILPGFPRFKLWPDAIESFGLDPGAMPRIRPALEKRDHSVGQNFQREPVELDRLYLLGEGPALAITPLTRREAFIELIKQTYTGTLLNMTETRGRHFHQVGRLVQKARVFRLTRPRQLSQLPAVVGALQEHIASRAA